MPPPSCRWTWPQGDLGLPHEHIFKILSSGMFSQLITHTLYSRLWSPLPALRPRHLSLHLPHTGGSSHPDLLSAPSMLLRATGPWHMLCPPLEGSFPTSAWVAPAHTLGLCPSPTSAGKPSPATWTRGLIMPRPSGCTCPCLRAHVSAGDGMLTGAVIW